VRTRVAYPTEEFRVVLKKALELLPAP
jgi:hypothetical protein